MEARLQATPDEMKRRCTGVIALKGGCEPARGRANLKRLSFSAHSAAKWRAEAKRRNRGDLTHLEIAKSSPVSRYLTTSHPKGEQEVKSIATLPPSVASPPSTRSHTKRTRRNGEDFSPTPCVCLSLRVRLSLVRSPSAPRSPLLCSRM